MRELRFKTLLTLEQYNTVLTALYTMRNNAIADSDTDAVAYLKSALDALRDAEAVDYYAECK